MNDTILNMGYKKFALLTTAALLIVAAVFIYVIFI
jgi:hypothetical protein